MSQPSPPKWTTAIGLSIQEVVASTGGTVSRTRLFELIRDGKVAAKKVGRRTIVMPDSLRDYLLRQPSAAASLDGMPPRIPGAPTTPSPAAASPAPAPADTPSHRPAGSGRRPGSPQLESPETAAAA